MTVHDWITSSCPHNMVTSLPSLVSDRKLRLFLCACCRRLWQFMTDIEGRQVIEVAERYADDLASSEELRQACLAAERVSESLWTSYQWTWRKTRLERRNNVATTTWLAVPRIDERAVKYASVYAAQNLAIGTLKSWKQTEALKQLTEEEHVIQARLLRDILGNPFQLPSITSVPITPLVVALAQAAYDERAYPSGNLDLFRLNVIADALEETGCDRDEILSHLRGPGPHVRGCWVVDRLLNKE